jgi:hypothetical protein
VVAIRASDDSIEVDRHHRPLAVETGCRVLVECERNEGAAERISALASEDEYRFGYQPVGSMSCLPSMPSHEGYPFGG